ncbi:hypothetical protein Hypma_004490 [Hypsizygus marmoreus]|uniref:Uncharacterized protein n=1 Tax=Hypsizygus marmoreus TaxID=39966 RepID=A0A369K159_HYPMA|nr:hypothetical protein Hypma_004490 [Hypsizygus marmoreus]
MPDILSILGTLQSQLAGQAEEGSVRNQQPPAHYSDIRPFEGVLFSYIATDIRREDRNRGSGIFDGSGSRRQDGRVNASIYTVCTSTAASVSTCNNTTQLLDPLRGGGNVIMRMEITFGTMSIEILG